MALLNTLLYSITSPCRVGKAEREKMFELLERYYDAVAYDRFLADLESKDFIVFLNDQRGRMGGYSTLSVTDTMFHGELRRVLFSGDTIVDYEYWGQQQLVIGWCKLAGILKAKDPQIPLYWFLICKGHRTYRFLPCFTKCFYPTWRSPTPGQIQEFMHFLATKKFGDAYDPARGIIDFGTSRGHLRAQWRGFSRVSNNKDAQFYKLRNPGCDSGHELMCLTELDLSNLRGFALHAFNEGLEHGLMGPDRKDLRTSCR